MRLLAFLSDIYAIVWMVLMLKIFSEICFAGFHFKKAIKYLSMSLYVTALWPIALFSDRGRIKLLKTSDAVGYAVCAIAPLELFGGAGVVRIIRR